MSNKIRLKRWKSGQPKVDDRRAKSKPKKPPARQGDVNSLGIFHVHERVSHRAKPADAISYSEADAFACWATTKLAVGDWRAVYEKILAMMHRDSPTAAQRAIREMFEVVHVPDFSSPEPWICARTLSVHMESGQWQQIAAAWGYVQTIEPMPSCERNGLAVMG